MAEVKTIKDTNILDIENLKVISCNKHEPKSDWYCKNLYPEGKLSNNCSFVNLGEVMHLYDENGKYFKTLYHNSKLKKEIMEQYNNY